MFIIVLKPFYYLSKMRNKNVLQYSSTLKGGRVKVISWELI